MSNKTVTSAPPTLTTAPVTSTSTMTSDNSNDHLHDIVEVPFVTPKQTLIRISIIIFIDLINISYRLLIIPCKIVKIKGSYQLFCNPLQKILCGCLTFLGILQGILLTRGAYTEEILEKPKIIFAIWGRLHVSLLIICWGYLFFLKQERIVLLLNCIDDDHGVHISKMKRLFSITIPSFAIVSHILHTVFVIILGGQNTAAFHNPDHSSSPSYDLEKDNDNMTMSIMERTIAQTLYTLFLSPNHTNIPDEFYYDIGGSHLKLKSSILLICAVHYLLRIYSMIIIGLCCAFMFASGWILNEGFKGGLRACDSLDKGELISREQELLEEYSNLRKLVWKVNSASRSIVLLLCSASVPVFVGRFMPVWDTSQTILRLMILFKMAAFVAPFVIASEAYDKSKQLQRRILELNHRDKDSKYCGQISRDDLGLCGGRFFTVSYGFMGSIASVYLSYAIMLLQMNPSPTNYYVGKTPCTCPTNNPVIGS